MLRVNGPGFPDARNVYICLNWKIVPRRTLLEGLGGDLFIFFLYLLALLSHSCKKFFAKGSQPWRPKGLRLENILHSKLGDEEKVGEAFNLSAGKADLLTMQVRFSSSRVLCIIRSAQVSADVKVTRATKF